jgi:His Kinase A (phospho-acceptor) domain
MAPDPQFTRPRHEGFRLSSETLSNARLALVACTLVATVAVLLAVTGQARGAQDALDEASAQTLRDYSGYASRLLGADVLRRFSERRYTILAPVTGGSGRDVPAPALTDIARLGRESFAALAVVGDTALGYYRIDVATGRLDGLDGVKGEFARRIADTVRALVPRFTPGTAPGIAAIELGHTSYSVVFAPFFDAHQRLVAVYGFAYTRGAVVGAVAATVFREVPLLPVSFAGARWNYDTTRVRAGEVINDSLIAMRVSERGGRLLWETRDAGSVIATSPYGARSVLSTSAGGIVVEAAMRQAAEPSLIPSIVRRAQSWTLRSLIGLAFLLVIVSLIALRGERQGARARRVEAMQQLALGLRHEINNALASMLLNAELLNEERTLTTEQHERLEAIVEQAERMRSVVRRLEKADKLDVLVPYLNEGLMVDLSTTRERDTPREFGRNVRA